VRRANVLIVILLASLALVLVACGKDKSTGGAAATTTATATATTATAAATTAKPAAPQKATSGGCRAVPAPAPAANPNRRRPRQRLDRKRTYTATIKTNCGTILVRLDVKRAPKTTASFAGLARTKFFDGLSFHRIAKPGGNDFVIQGGDPLGSGNGGPGYSVVEAPPKGTTYHRYDVAMAKTQTDPPGSSGSQFFIVTAADAGLPPDYAILGTVVGGKRVVQRISAVPTDPATEAPLDPVVMSSVRITSRR
jgi:peptidyl-prolyl cis-trans isomerase B (cyclophilin B)